MKIHCKNKFVLFLAINLQILLETHLMPFRWGMSRHNVTSIKSAQPCCYLFLAFRYTRIQNKYGGQAANGGRLRLKTWFLGLRLIEMSSSSEGISGQEGVHIFRLFQMFKRVPSS